MKGQTGNKMTKSSSYLHDFFHGDHVTVVLKTRNDMHNEDGDIVEGHMVAEGLLLELDDEFLYLSGNVDIGITEAINRKDILRIMLTDYIQSEQDVEVIDKGKLN